MNNIGYRNNFLTCMGLKRQVFSGCLSVRQNLACDEKRAGLRAVQLSINSCLAVPSHESYVSCDNNNIVCSAITS